jgi:hypothetical protein
VLAGIDPESSWERFLVAVESDIGDVQGGTTKEGIHMGVMSGTLDLLQRAYLGAGARDGVLTFDPRLTLRLDGLALSLVFQGTTIRVSVGSGELTVAVQSEGFSHPVRIGLGGEVRELGAGQEWTVALDREGRVAPRHATSSEAATATIPATAPVSSAAGDSTPQASTTPAGGTTADGGHDHGGNGA